jgi:tyrosyl-tRNA synthetase
MIKTDDKTIEELLNRGVDEVIIKEDLEKALRSGQKLRIKFGVDPTAPDLHLGHAVPLKKLRQFQDAGHQAILLIGDFTAAVGDPTGRNETRPMKTAEEIRQNLKTYIDQASKILDMSKVELRYNSEWYKDKGWDFIMTLTGKITVARVLDRDDFQKRLANGSDIQMQEILYPLMQGYDSVELKADVEIGGTDQKFNMLMGRKLQKRYDQAEQNVLTCPLLEGTDGERKMSKSYGNYIALLDTPDDMFGKIMSLPDSMIIRYFELASDKSYVEIEDYKQRIKTENPRDLKFDLAESIIAIYHNQEAAAKAKENFIQTFSKKETPDEMPELHPSANDIVTVLTEATFVTSRAEARRALEQNGVRVNQEVITDINYQVKSGDVVQKGKRFFVKII